MATKTAPAPPALLDRVDGAVQSVRGFAESAGSAYWGRIVVHYLHVYAFLILAVSRQHTTLPVLAWLQRSCGDAFHGWPALALHHLASSFDAATHLMLMPFHLP